jgi:hypothetical protein
VISYLTTSEIKQLRLTCRGGRDLVDQLWKPYHGMNCRKLKASRESPSILLLQSFIIVKCGTCASDVAGSCQSQVGGGLYGFPSQRVAMRSGPNSRCGWASLQISCKVLSCTCTNICFRDGVKTSFFVLCMYAEPQLLPPCEMIVQFVCSYGGVALARSAMALQLEKLAALRPITRCTFFTYIYTQKKTNKLRTAKLRLGHS